MEIPWFLHGLHYQERHVAWAPTKYSVKLCIRSLLCCPMRWTVANRGCSAFHPKAGALEFALAASEDKMGIAGEGNVGSGVGRVSKHTEVIK